jgi:membrane-bound lytic murein transglycosylase C
MFNPWAKSPAPAFGLMQLMPGGGARDAFRFLYAKDRVVHERYLYDPDNNIELGVAYLHLLYFRYFRHIKDPVARTWASVAAYNTGAQKVIEAFSGKYKKKRHASRLSWKRHALSKINSMDSENVYKHLQQFLPYEETRNYIRKVRDRMKKYQT